MDSEGRSLESLVPHWKDEAQQGVGERRPQACDQVQGQTSPTQTTAEQSGFPRTRPRHESPLRPAPAPSSHLAEACRPSGSTPVAAVAVHSTQPTTRAEKEHHHSQARVRLSQGSPEHQRAPRFHQILRRKLQWPRVAVLARLLRSAKEHQLLPWLRRPAVRLVAPFQTDHLFAL